MLSVLLNTNVLACPVVNSRAKQVADCCGLIINLRVGAVSVLSIAVQASNVILEVFSIKISVSAVSSS